jgi:hypothetical protein
MDVANETFKDKLVLLTEENTYGSCDFERCVLRGKNSNFVRCRLIDCTITIDKPTFLTCTLDDCVFDTGDGGASFTNCMLKAITFPATQQTTNQNIARKIGPFLTLPYWQWS